ncbi:type II secretion system F family protein [Mumia sp. zg.B53]|uniref:type II secretion system F family protein n=1 Tax=unclassified Mumia TaxID=2621872 RepID=UPI001C6E3DAC|nr:MULTISPECIES: type II secretion system F family protein [unclassified Mumia]MBW9209072.1 type II secretion system F family protein [Mumia sp. zg.B21]MBW9213683.1 type II secretion system F family protein [Mumia sp. zg.B53]
MGYVLGLGIGVGALLVWSGVTAPARDGARGRRRGSLDELLARAGAPGTTARGLILVCAACGLGGLVVALLVTATPTVALVAGIGAAYVPLAVIRGRAGRVAEERAAAWPEAVDHLASAVRAGMSLPEAISGLGERGPEPLREPFVAFARDYQASGRFAECLDGLKARLADPVGDRVVEALRVARDVGGGDLGRMLRTLSGFLRDDLRTRGELVARQAWTINGARLAVSAPWIVLGLMSLQRDAITRFGSGTGLALLVVGLAVCVLAYRLMLLIGRLPREPRVLR